MKILFVGSLSQIACSTFYLKALRVLKHNVVTYDPLAFETSRAVDRWKVRFTKAPLPHKISRIQSDLLTLCHKHPFDIIFVIAENFIPDIIEEIQNIRKPTPKFIYHSHDNNFSKGILKPDHFFKSLAKYDLVFTTKSQNVSRYKELGNPNSFFIPSAFEPSAHRPIKDSLSRFRQNSIDVSFVGTYDHSRDRYLAALKWENLYVWGDLWKRYRHYRRHSDHITPRAIYLDEYADVLSHSKISLGLLREEAEDLHTQRTLEIPACGSLQIAPRNEEILTLFEEDKEIVCFDSPEELQDKVVFYLKNDTERNRIALAGYNRCLKDRHTYLDRVETMLNKAQTLSL